VSGAEAGAVGNGSSDRAALKTLAVLAVLSTCLYGLISLMSWRFEFDQPGSERPIVEVLVLFAAAFISYLFAIRIAARARQDRQLLAMIVVPAIVFRVVLLFSVPIQEVDIYRYLWDGAVSTTGVSPFRYSPDQVRAAASSVSADEELQELVGMLDREPALVEILRRVHFGQLPTIYPPVSQAVFAAAAFTTPRESSIATHVFVMKAWLVGFDVATLILVIGLLIVCRKPIGFCVIYAWCPLLLKEVANSGHLDAIAVFLATLAVYLAVRLLSRLRGDEAISAGRIGEGCVVAAVLALAVGAKLYPVVLAPLMLFVFASALGWRRTALPAVTFSVVMLCVLWPLLPQRNTASQEVPQVAAADSPPLPPSVTPLGDPSLGVKTFLRRWEMNDFIFLVIVENLKPLSHLESGRAAWFSVVPDSIREQIITSASVWSGMTEAEVPFLISRGITAVLFLVVACWLAWRAARTPDVRAFCEAGFLTLAWFWLLCPTQNPWYWTWALPLLPFARSRAWLAMSGLVLTYYLRFWLTYHFPDTAVLHTGYAGATFFDFVVTWIEFAPWLLWLAVEFAASLSRVRVSHVGLRQPESEDRDWLPCRH